MNRIQMQNEGAEATENLLKIHIYKKQKSIRTILELIRRAAEAFDVIVTIVAHLHLSVFWIDVTRIRID